MLFDQTQLLHGWRLYGHRDRKDAGLYIPPGIPSRMSLYLKIPPVQLLHG
jgi:hypothetical protein